MRLGIHRSPVRSPSRPLPLNDGDDEEKEQYARFKREAQAAGRLQHPNIVSAFDYGETEANAYIVMEYMSGPSLKTLMAKHEPLPLPLVGEIMRGLLAGLQHSHGRGVVHRDIKPANVTLTADGEVKITDFGIAHLESSSMTRAGSVMGTPAYMAPEQVLGQPVDARTDIFSAGVLFYEMLTGRRPFEGSEASIMHQIVHMAPPQPSRLVTTVSPGIDAVIIKAIAKDPADRFASAAVFDDAVRSEFARMSALGSDPADDIDLTVQAKRTVPVLPPSLAAPASDPTSSLAAAASVAQPSEARRGTSRRGVSVAATIVGVAAITGIGVLAWLGFRAPVPHPSANPPVANPVVAGAPPTAVSPPGAHPVAEPAAHPGAPPQPPLAASQPEKTPGGPLRQQVAAIVSTSPCSVITPTVVSDSQLRLRGVSGLGDTSQMELQAMLGGAIRTAAPNASVAWDVHPIDGPYRPVLDLMRSVEDGHSGAGVTISLPADRSKLSDGQAVQIAVSVARPSARLTLDWFAHDGSVHHLHDGPIDGSQAYVVSSWLAGKPNGDQLVTALVTSTDLFPQKRPEQEPASVYLKDLQAALERTGSNSDAVAADVASLVFVPR